MLNEPHYPSKWSVLLVFLVILLSIVGVLAWAFYFNLGTIIVSSDRGFSLEVGGESYDCSDGTCELSFAPNIYELVARTNGYYDESFSLEVLRGQQVEKDLPFQLIPYLQSITAEELPPVEPNRAQLKPEGEGMGFYLGERFVTAFETLSSPTVLAAGNTGLVVDRGRLFFVNLENGRKLRRFDDTITVNDVLLSDNGKKLLLFVQMQGIDQLWLWLNDSDELLPQPWSESADRVQWQPSVDHRIFVITDQLQDTSGNSIFAEFVGSVDQFEEEVALFSYNLDSAEAKKIADFEEQSPERLIRRGERYFVEFEDGELQELVVQ